MKDQSIGARIINARELIDMNQIDLGREIGLDKSAMSKIESGTRKVSSDELLKICQVLGVSADHLIGNSNKKIAAELTNNDIDFTYNGEIVSDEDMELVRRVLRGK